MFKKLVVVWFLFSSTIICFKFFLKHYKLFGKKRVFIFCVLHISRNSILNPKKCPLVLRKYVSGVLCVFLNTCYVLNNCFLEHFFKNTNQTELWFLMIFFFGNI